jgi:hypothetical protein
MGLMFELYIMNPFMNFRLCPCKVPHVYRELGQRGIREVPKVCPRKSRWRGTKREGLGEIDTFLCPRIERSGAYSFWPVRLFVCLSAKTLTLAISFDREVIGISYFTCGFLMTRPFFWYHNI